jgi:D-methionine transport system substrate-binding protein
MSKSLKKRTIYGKGGVIKSIPVFGVLSFLLLFLAACSSKADKKNVSPDESKIITIGITKKPTYPDLIKYAIQPLLEKEGYTLKFVEIDDSHLFNQVLIDKEIDVNIGQHEAALNFSKANNPDWQVSSIISVPSAHMGFYSDKYDVKTLDELKEKVQKGDVVAMPDDVTNLSRSLLFLENTGFLTIKKGVDKFSATEKDIDRNPYDLQFKVVRSEQIPRILSSLGFGLIYGDDADLLGILDKAIIREVDEDDQFLIVFVVNDEEKDKHWVRDFVEAVQSEAFKNVVEDQQHRFHKYYRPSWYREKWGIGNEWGK